MTNIILAMLIQSSYLIHYDIYALTKPNYIRNYQYKGIQYDSTEFNPIANLFFRNDLWDLGYTLALGANIAATYYLNKIDSKYAKYYLSALSIVEVLAISTWENFSKNKIKVNALVVYETF